MWFADASKEHRKLWCAVASKEPERWHAIPYAMSECSTARQKYDANDDTQYFDSFKRIRIIKGISFYARKDLL